ncbi:MAG TPA: helix-turn-helix domain-containing protein [Streptosporangiaceae bacterium]
MSSPDVYDGSWTLLTGHGHVLVEIARNPQARIRDISAVVGLTERSVQAIVADLKAAGYLTSTRTGRRTQYTVNHSSMFRHSAQEGLRVGPFLAMLAASGDAASEPAEEADAPTPAARDRDGTAVPARSRRSPAAVARSLTAPRKHQQDPGRRSGKASDARNRQSAEPG